MAVFLLLPPPTPHPMQVVSKSSAPRHTPDLFAATPSPPRPPAPSSAKSPGDFHFHLCPRSSTIRIMSSPNLASHSLPLTPPELHSSHADTGLRRYTQLPSASSSASPAALPCPPLTWMLFPKLLDDWLLLLQNSSKVTSRSLPSTSHTSALICVLCLLPHYLRPRPGAVPGVE